MSFLRLDDNFTQHPKVIALGSRARRWTWLEVLAYTCRYDDHRIPADIKSAVSGATRGFLRDCEQLFLIDRDENGALFVHDWHLYNGSIEDRVRAYLDEHPEATANEVQSQIHGRREVVLGIVRIIRAGSGEPPGGSQSGSTGTEKVVPEVVPTAPAPAKEQEQVKPIARKPRAPDILWDTMVELIGASPGGMERGRWNKALQSLRQSGATPDTLRTAAAAYRSLPTFADCVMTPTALASNWTTLTANGNGSHIVTESAEQFRARIAASEGRWK